MVKYVKRREIDKERNSYRLKKDTKIMFKRGTEREREKRTEKKRKEREREGM